MMGLAEGDGSYVFPESAPVEMRERLRAAVAGGHATPGPTDDAEIADDDKNTEGEEVEDEPPPPGARASPTPAGEVRGHPCDVSFRLCTGS